VTHNELSVENYNILLDTTKENLSYSGSVEINLNIHKKLNEVLLDSKGLNIHRCYIYDNKSKQYEIINHEISDSKLSIKYNSLKSGSKIKLKIDFDGKITNNLKGIYASNYKTPNNKNEVLISTQFEPTDARKAFPCIDHPSYKAKFNLTLIIDSNLQAISNMPIYKESKLNDYNTKIIFEETPIMSTYLLFFAIGKIKCKEINTKNNITIRVWATNNQEKYADFALETSEKLLTYFESYFGTDYPLPKLDHIAIPDFAAGAMENWGCISYRENALLVDPEKSSIQTKQLVAAIIAHEMAHMWFGDLVTMKWWNDLWLNESFASWMGDKAVSKIHPEWDVWTKFILDDTNRAFELDALDSSHPIEQEVTNPDEIGQLFDAISYSKGASLIRMLENYIGEENFKNGIQSYMSKHQYSNTVTNDLWNALSENSDKNIKTLMEKWTTTKGFPLLNLKETEDKIQISQEKFSYDPNNKDNSQWLIPIKYSLYKNNTKIENEILISDKDEYIDEDTIAIFNNASSGFYKTLYSDTMFKKISDILEKDLNILSNEERLGLISDTYTLLKANKLSPEYYLNLISKFEKETNPYIWKYICGSLRSIDSKLYNTYSYEKFYKYSHDIFNNVSIDLNWDLDDSISETNQIMVTTLIENGCYFGISSLNLKSKEIFKNITLSNIQDIHPNLKKPLLMSIAYNGLNDDFDKIWKMYLESNSQEEKALFLASLTQFKNIEKIGFLLNQVTSNNIRKHDIASLLLGVASNNISLVKSWDYLKENWSKIIEISGDGFQLNYIVSLPSYFQTQDRLEEVENYYSENHVDAASMSMKQTVEKIRNNIVWLDSNLKKFENYL
tara:strand:- start:997 stop:3528 length:2532 start_codon:yes stop_codon:yes gene_type:complete